MAMAAAGDAVPASRLRPVSERRPTVSGRVATDALKMACPMCGGTASAVVRSRGSVSVDCIKRRRECADCGFRFPTIEGVDYECMQRELAQKHARGPMKGLPFPVPTPPPPPPPPPD